MQGLKRFFYVAQNTSQRCIRKDVRRHVLATQRLICRYKHDLPDDFENVEEETEAKAYMQMSHDYLGTGTGGHRAYVLQPYVKWGHDKRRNTTPELQLAEAVALVNTLPNWTVSSAKCVPLLTLSRKKLLGEGSLQSLRKEIGSSNVTAIFVSAHMLKFVQIAELEEVFQLPIYDRYSIVIHIFRQHAKSPEARLQVALAEIPYIRKKMSEVNEHRLGRNNLLESRKRILESRERKLRTALRKLEEHRKLIRNQRKTCGFPSVAVVGYTNAGKTSLIKALTGDGSLLPENKLFATLDTTVHEGMLPSRLKVLYVDTIGFIQDVPEALLAPFTVTLEDALIADIVLHVYDLGHPDVVAQVQHVRETIKPMIDENKVVIDVANKCDVLESKSLPVDVVCVSALKLTGIDALRSMIDQKLLDSTGLMRKRIRVLSGGDATSWLYKETTVTDAMADPDDPQYLILDVIMTPTAFYRLKKYLKE